MSDSVAEALPSRLLETLFAEAPVRWEEPNGLTVVLRDEPGTGLAAVQLWVKTGSLHEGAWLGGGLSHYLEHMLFKGTPRRPGAKLAEEVQSLGATINAYTSFERTVYYIDGPSEAVPAAVDLLADACLHAALGEDDARKERDVILREIDMGDDEPDRQVAKALFRTAFREHPYRHPVIGYREVFAAVEPADLRAYHAARYVPNQMVLVVAGDVREETLRPAVAAAFAGAVRRRLGPALVPPEPPQFAPRVERLQGKVNVARGTVAYRVPGLGHPDAPACDILAAALGQGTSSLLWERLREGRELVEHIEASNWNPGDLGLLWISYVCDPARAEEAEAAVHEELARLAEGGLDEARLRKAQRQAVVSEVNARKTVSGLAGRLGSAEVVAGDLGFARHYFERLRALGPAEVDAVARRVLVPAGRTSILHLPHGRPAMAASTPAARRAPPKAALHTLPNGARLILLPDARLPKVHWRLAGLGGPAAETPGQQGVTTLAATLLTKDTANRPAAEVATLIEGLGGQLHDHTGNNTFTLSLETLAADTPTALEVLADALLRSEFRPKTVANERKALVSALEEELDELPDLARHHVRRLAFGEHPHADGPLGRVETLRALTAETARAQAARLLAGGNVVLAVCGDFDPAEMADRAGAIVGALRPGPACPTAPALPALARAGRVVEPLPDKSQAVAFAAFPAPGLLDDDYFEGEVLDEMLSDMSGRLFVRVREERGLAYWVGASRVVGVRGGLFYLSAGTRPDAVETVFREFRRALEEVAAGAFAPAELERSRRRLRVARRASRQAIGGRALQAALRLLYGQSPDDEAEYEQKLAAVTPESVAAFVRRRALAAPLLEYAAGAVG